MNALPHEVREEDEHAIKSYLGEQRHSLVRRAVEDPQDIEKPAKSKKSKKKKASSDSSTTTTAPPDSTEKPDKTDKPDKSDKSTAKPKKSKKDSESNSDDEAAQEMLEDQREEKKLIEKIRKDLKAWKGWLEAHDKKSLNLERATTLNRLVREIYAAYFPSRTILPPIRRTSYRVPHVSTIESGIGAQRTYI